MFAIDFTKPYLYKDVVYFHQGNLSTNNTLRCTLNTGGSNDLTGCNIMCTFKLQNSTEISGVGRIIDPLNAIVDLVFPSNALAVGLNKLEILVNRSDGSVAQSPSITYDIWQGLTTGNGIEAETNYPILIELINSTNEASNKANSALNKANSMITDITDAIDNAYRSANEADIATSNANTKIEEVETAKTEMIKKVDTSIDTMNSSVEDAKASMQATTDAKMQQVDNSIVTMKSDVETAKNEMASKADEKIADIDRALASGTVDLELKASRDGEESLPARLKRDLYIDEVPVKQRVLNLENMKEMQDLEYSTDKGYAICEKTGNGTVKDLKIYGRSLVNLLSNPKMNFTTSSTGWSNIIAEDNTILQQGKTYTLIPRTITNRTGINGYLCELNYDDGTRERVYDSGNLERCEVKVFTPKQNVSRIASSLRQSNESYQVTFECIVLEGDYSQNPPQYFEGITSIGNDNKIEVSSVKWSGNLFDDRVLKPYITTENNSEYTLDYGRIWVEKAKLVNLPFKPNTSYKIICTQKASGVNAKPRFYFHYTDGTEDQITIANENWETVIGISRSNKTLEYISATYGNSGGTWTIKKNSICLYEDTSKTEYEPFEQDKKTPLFKDLDGAWKPILNVRGVDENNCDIVDTVNNVFTKKYFEDIIDGSQTITKGTTIEDTTGFTIRLSNKTLDNSNSTICDKYPVNVNCYSQPIEGVFGAGLNVFIRIKSSKASTAEQLKTYLQTNNFKVVCPLYDIKTYEINPIYPEAFEDETLMLFKTGPISPRATWKITSNLVGVLGNVKDRVKRMENDFYKYTVTQNRIQLGTTYSSDRTTFRVDTATFTTEKAKQDLDYDLFRLLRHNILVGPKNYDKAEMENMMDFYVSVGKIDYNMWDELYMLIEEQHNPPVEEEAPVI